MNGVSISVSNILSSYGYAAASKKPKYLLKYRLYYTNPCLGQECQSNLSSGTSRVSLMFLLIDRLTCKYILSKLCVNARLAK